MILCGLFAAHLCFQNVSTKCSNKIIWERLRIVCWLMESMGRNYQQSARMSNAVPSTEVTGPSSPIRAATFISSFLSALLLLAWFAFLGCTACCTCCGRTAHTLKILKQTNSALASQPLECSEWMSKDNVDLYFCLGSPNDFHIQAENNYL